MKHILNEMSEEEKNSIRGQHTGGKNIDTTKFKKLMESKLGNTKPLISEQGIESTPSMDERDNDKDKLIEVLTNHINSMKNNKEFNGMSVAQTIYNDCAHFMNKTDMFSSRSGEPLSTKVPFAPES